jgi:hypothetical protein
LSGEFDDADFSDADSGDGGDGASSDLASRWNNLATDQPAPSGSSEIEPPLSWPAERKARWSSLSPEDREFIAQREREAHTRISQQGDELAELRARVGSGQLDEYAQKISTLQAEIEKHVAAQARWDQEQAQRDNQAAFEKFARQGRDYLLDPEMQSALAQEMRAILQQVPQLKGEHLLRLAHDRLAERMGPQIEQRKSAAQQQREAEARQYQQALAQAEQRRQQGIASAIEQRDHEWSRLLQQERASWELKARETEQLRQKEAEEKTKWAKRAAAVNVKGAPGHGNQNPKTVDDTLRQIAARVYGER